MYHQIKEIVGHRVCQLSAGGIITISEPDLQVLANQVPSISNPVIIGAVALGVGVSSIRSDRHAGDDSFGLVALCSIGPILAVLILGFVYPPEGTYTPVEIPYAETSQDSILLFLEAFPTYLHEVTMALTPIIAFFFLFQVFVIHLAKRALLRICAGLVYTYAGLVLFLTGVNVGFMPVGNSYGT